MYNKMVRCGNCNLFVSPVWTRWREAPLHCGYWVNSYLRFFVFKNLMWKKKYFWCDCNWLNTQRRNLQWPKVAYLNLSGQRKLFQDVEDIHWDRNEKEYETGMSTACIIIQIWRILLCRCRLLGENKNFRRTKWAQFLHSRAFRGIKIKNKNFAWLAAFH